MKKMPFAAIVCLLLFAACNNTDRTVSSDNKNDSATVAMDDKEIRESRNRKTVGEIIDAYNAQNFEASFKDFSADVIEYSDGTSPAVKGLDSVKRGSLDFLKSFSNIKAENVQVAADGDWVMVWATWSGTWSKDLGAQKATGKSFKIQDVDIYKFDKDGKVTEHHAIQPFSTVKSQIGLK